MEFRNKFSILIVILLLFGNQLFAQTDREFWFVAPEVTENHPADTNNWSWPGGEPIYLQISCLNLDADVTISIPAEPAFTPIELNMTANTSERVELTSFINFIENRPSDIVLNKGIFIESTQMITAYYDEDEHYNMDVFALKGKNALGTEFYTPFQNYWRNGDYDPSPRCAIDVVATQNNTNVTITPTAAIDGHPAGVPYTVVNLNRGQTYSFRAVNRSAASHLGGSHITSTKPIAVTISDDSVEAQGEGGCKDIIGDQLVPIELIGYEYLVMRGQLWDACPSPYCRLASPTRDVHESAYIMPIQDGTEIFVDGVSVGIYNTADIYRAELDLFADFMHVRGSSPVYVLHVAGFGCEMGGAVLPTIDGCTGSTDVSFTRSTSQEFFMNLMIKNDDPEKKNSFYFEYEDGTTFQLDSNWFDPVPGTFWVVLNAANKEFGDSLNGGVPTSQVTRIYNTMDVFHMGMINGGTTSGCKYGYFSDYTVDRGNAEIANTHTDFIQTCYGDTLQLLAAGGIDYAWDTDPPGEDWLIYMSDTSISTPKVYLPPGSYPYKVDITRPCVIPRDTTVKIIINIFDKLDASFSLDETQACSPLTVNITDESIGAEPDRYKWDFGDGSPLNLTNSPPPHTYTNTSDTAQTYEIQLLVKNYADCSDTLRQNVIVYPFIDAEFEPNDFSACNPMGVQYVNNTTGGTLNNAIYEWDFGDGGTSFDSIPYHTFQNNGTVDSVYTTTFVAKSEFNCTDTARHSYTVHPFIDAVYAIDRVIGCSPLTVNINTTQYGGITEYRWDFGDGSLPYSGPNPPPHTYTNSTGVTNVYDLELVVDNGNCTDTLIRQITVYSDVTAGFTTSATDVCNPTNISFTNTSSTWVSTYAWYFDDGGSSGIANPSHLFQNTGTTDITYTTELIVNTVDGCKDTATQDITVHSYILADFTIDEGVGCAPLAITINNQSQGGISEYRWDFGDGSTHVSIAFEATVNHTYTNTTGAPIVRDIELVVDNGNCTDTIMRSITVYPTVVADFNMNIDNGCHPLSISFTNTSTVPPPATYNWDFGDGGSSILEHPIHTFYNYGNTDIVETIKLIVSSQFNCVDSISQDIDIYHKATSRFTIDKTFDCPPLEVTLTNNSEGADSYLWDFGDGNTSTATNPSHTYDNTSSVVQLSTLSLVAETSHNCNDTSDLTVSSYPRVIAGFDDVVPDCHPYEVTFNNTTINADNYYWDFDDGITSGTEHPQNRFVNTTDANFDYSVMLIASSDYNCVDTIIKDVRVYPSPEAEFFVSPVNQVFYDPSADVSFQNVTNHQSIWNYEWDFGDGNTSGNTDANFNHSYTGWALPSNSFIYTISLRAFSDYCSDDVEHTIFVTPPLPEINIVDNEPRGCAPLTVSFAATTNYADYFLWDFDDGSTSTEMEPVHIFENSGTYYVSLEVEGDGGSAFDYVEVIVEPDPVANFSYYVTDPDGIFYLDEDTLFCSNESQYGETYVWSLGDGTTADGETISHIYDELGVYDLSLFVTSEYGCTDFKEVLQAVEVKGRRKLILPNAFSPYSTGGKNDTFKPLSSHEGIIEYRLYVFNRWGEKLFETHDPDEGWDGYYKGKKLNQDVYIWKVRATFTDGTEMEKAGDVTLLH